MAAGHYTYLDHVLPQVSEAAAGAQKYIVAVAVGAIMVAIGARLASRLRDPKEIEQAIVPSKKLSLFGFVDLAFEAFVKYQDSTLGKENRHHAPFCASIFFFILFLNLLGLIPGFPAATTLVWVNVAMALVVFAYFNVWGVKEHGLWNYLKHFAPSGLPLLMFPIVALVFVVEILSMTLRPLTLNLRLYWNITADHKVLDTFTNLMPNFPFFGLPFYALGIFVCFMQAFVFVTLTMVYILLATQHEEEHSKENE